MSYCWRLQYYCKLGAAHGAGPIYYVSRLPQQAHQPVRESVEFQPFPGRARGDTQGLAMTSHCATGRRDGKPPAQAGRGAQTWSLCRAVSGGRLMAGSSGWRWRQLGDHRLCHPLPHDLFHAHIVVQELWLDICAQRRSSPMTSHPRCWQSQPQSGLASDLE